MTNCKWIEIGQCDCSWLYIQTLIYCLYCWWLNRAWFQASVIKITWMFRLSNILHPYSKRDAMIWIKGIKTVVWVMVIRVICPIRDGNTLHLFWGIFSHFLPLCHFYPLYLDGVGSWSLSYIVNTLFANDPWHPLLTWIILNTSITSIMKFGNGYVISYHTKLGMILFIHDWIKVKAC